MIQIINIIYNNCIKPLIPKCVRMRFKMMDAIKYPIIQDPISIFPIVYRIKDASWESVVMFDVFQLSKSWTMQQYSPAQAILQIDNAIVHVNSDVVVSEGNAIWDKAYTPVFSKDIPLDKGLLKYTNNSVFIRKSKHAKKLKGEYLSMLGVHSTIWAHFLVQFLPKLYYADEAGLFDKDITIIMPKYTDHHIVEIVSNVLSYYPNVKKYEVEEENVDEIQCEKLYYIPTASTLSNHAEWLAPYDIVIPLRVIDILQKRLVKLYVEKTKDELKEHDKIFLVRRGIRSLPNIDVIEDYFKERGFYLVEPHKYSLEEKVVLFRHAKVIVGPQSSAWTNILFSQGARGLMFSSLCRTLDAYVAYINKLGESKIIMVTGEDLCKSTHADYHISLDKIKEAYQFLINEEYERDNDK